MVLVPVVNDVDSSVHVVGVLVRLRIQHSVAVAPPRRPGSRRRKLATMPLAAWLTVTVWPATVSVPVRVPLAAATLNVTAPLPVPLAPDVTVMKSDWLAAVQAHEASVVTLTVNVPPPVGALTDVGDTVNAHAPAVRN